VGIITLPDRRSSYKTIETAIGSSLGVVNILEEYHRRPDPYEKEGLVTLLDGIAFAPGLSNVTLGEGIRKVQATSAVARVGGIPG
jgi:hypothetical protein